MRFETRGLGKSFGAVQVLKNIDFVVDGGHCHAIVGANGAGKSTFIHTLSGVFSEYHGEISIDNRTVDIFSPLAAKENQIGCVHQEFDKVLFQDLSLLENVLLPLRTGKRMGFSMFPTKADRVEVQAILARVGLSMTDQDLAKPIREFRPAVRQKIVIAKVLAEGSKLIIFDEPTSSLGHDDAANLLNLIRILKAENIAIIYISHHLSEVTEIADEVSVFRAGEKAAHFYAEEADLSTKIVREMLNQELEDIYPQRSKRILTDRVKAEILFEVKDITIPMHLQNVSFAVKKGEIFGVTGLIGAGKSSLIKMLYGLTTPANGELRWKGEKIKRFDINQSIQKGIAMVPEDRRNQGLILEDSISQNISLPNLPLIRNFGFLNRKKEMSLATEAAQKTHLATYRMDLSVSRLSGGNQQKIVLGKWLMKNPVLLLLDEPTKGIDVGAKSELYHLLRDLANQGTTIVIATSEPEEALGLADRIAVMRSGKIVEIRDAEQWVMDDILLCATGGTAE